MNITIQELLASKAYVKEGGAVTFHTPNFYLGKFIQAADRFEVIWNVNVSEPVMVADEDETRHSAYPRVMIEASFREPESLQKFTPVIGMIYALDIQKPIIKAYSGYNVSVCTNLTMFRADLIEQKDLMGDYAAIYDKVQEWLDGKPRELQEFKRDVEYLKDATMDLPEFDRLTGQLIRFGMKSKFGTQLVLNAVKTMKDPNSRYYFKEDEPTTRWNYFNALTQQITDGRDLLDRANKTVEIARLLLD